MAQHDMNIANQSFPSTRTDINNALAAIVSTHSGTSAPSTTFAGQIWLDTSTSTLFIRNNDNDGNIPLMQFDQSADVAATLATVIDILDASGTDQAGQNLTIRAGAGTGTGAGGSIILQTADGAGSTGSSVNSHATQVTITDDGKCGIGTSTPGQKLNVAGAGARIYLDGANEDIDMDASANGQLKLDANGYAGAIALNSTGMQLYHNSSSLALIFGTNETERMRIDHVGNVFIATTSTPSTSSFGYRFAATGLMKNSRDTSGTGAVAQFFGNAGEFRVLGDGDAQNTNNSYTGISDEKLKENISDALSQWDDIKAVRVRKYSLKERKLDAADSLGVIAQELEASGMNGLVKEVEADEDSEETIKTVKYSILYMKAVKALQEAMERIETLETKVAALEG